MQGNGKKSVDERTVRCVMLLPSGGNVPEDLLVSLRNRKVSVTTVASPASLMAELGLCEIEFSQRRNASSMDMDLSSPPVEGDGGGDGGDGGTGNSGSENTSWREPLIMLVVEPDEVPDLDMISDAVANYFPLVLRWRYAENANPRLGPLLTSVQIDQEMSGLISNDNTCPDNTLQMKNISDTPDKPDNNNEVTLLEPVDSLLIADDIVDADDYEEDAEDNLETDSVDDGEDDYAVTHEELSMLLSMEQPMEEDQ